MTVDPQSRARTTWRTVVAILAATLLFAGGYAADSAADDETVAAETTTTTSPTTTAPTSTAPPTTTTTTEAVDPPADLSGLRDMVDSDDEVYNSGNAEAARALLSPLSPEASPPNLEFWIESLGEQVTADCVPSVDLPGGLTCVERYSDQLHGPGGETIRATFHYVDRDGLLSRIHDRFEMRLLECFHLDFRCPGDAVDIVGNDVIWSYEIFEADLFLWLEQSYPEVAQSIGEPANLSYSSGKPEAVAAALPQAHPGASAPLGWSLSDRAMDDLQAQLAVNESQLGLIQQWLTGTMTCDPLCE